MTRRADGSGTITPMANGRFWARLGDRERTSLGTFASEPEAKTAIDVARNLAAQRGHTTGRTVSEFGKAMLDRRELEGVANVRTERGNFKNHVETSELAPLAVAEVLPVHCAGWLRKLSQKRAMDKRGPRKLHRKTVQHCHTMMTAIFDEAIVDGIRPDNPFRAIRQKRRQAEADETEEVWDWLRPEEQAQFLTCELIPRWGRLMAQFAWGTGLRQQEMWNLELRDLQVKGEDPHVFVRYGAVGKKPKSGKQRRVPLFGHGLEAATAWLENLATFARANPHRLVFPMPSGRRRDKGAPKFSTYSRVTKKRGKAFYLPMWLAAAGITRHVRWHDLRHTAASCLVSGSWGHRWTLEEVKDFMGHSSITVTQIYAHLADDALKNAARQTAKKWVKPEPEPAI